MTVDETLRTAQQRGFRLICLRQTPLGNWQAAFANGPVCHAQVECMTPAEAAGEALKLAMTRTKEPPAPAAADVFE